MTDGICDTLGMDSNSDILGIDRETKLHNLRCLLQQEREQIECYRKALLEAYNRLPEIWLAQACPVCHRFIWSSEDHKYTCLYRTLGEALEQRGVSATGLLAEEWREINFTYQEAKELLDLFGEDEETEISVREVSENEPSHSGSGKYAYYTEYPDEGSQLLGMKN